jgi:hypothetical protein
MSQAKRTTSASVLRGKRNIQYMIKHGVFLERPTFNARPDERPLSLVRRWESPPELSSKAASHSYNAACFGWICSDYPNRTGPDVVGVTYAYVLPTQTMSAVHSSSSPKGCQGRLTCLLYRCLKRVTVSLISTRPHGTSHVSLVATLQSKLKVEELLRSVTCPGDVFPAGIRVAELACDHARLTLRRLGVLMLFLSHNVQVWSNAIIRLSASSHMRLLHRPAFRLSVQHVCTEGGQKR